MQDSDSGPNRRFQASSGVDLAPFMGAFFFMTLPYFPRRGEVLICDFDSGFLPPEMVKKRPVVVVLNFATLDTQIHIFACNCGTMHARFTSNGGAHDNQIKQI